MNKANTILSLIVVALLGVIAYGLISYAGNGFASFGAKDEVGSTVVREGVVEEVDTTQAMVDGPVIVRIKSDHNKIETILIPSMGLPLCAAFGSIDNVWTLTGGERIMVRGSLSADGSITPCTEASHYLKVESKSDEEAVACTLDAKICPDGSAVGRTGPNCEFQACPAAGNTKKVVDFKIGDSITLGTVRLTPVKVLSDSRCPADVQCVWAGELTALVNVEGHEHIFKLNEAQVLEGYSITLTKASPTAISTKELAQGDYTLTFEAVLQ